MQTYEIYSACKRDECDHAIEIVHSTTANSS